MWMLLWHVQPTKNIVLDQEHHFMATVWLEGHASSGSCVDSASKFSLSQSDWESVGCAGKTSPTLGDLQVLMTAFCCLYLMNVTSIILDTKTRPWPHPLMRPSHLLFLLFQDSTYSLLWLDNTYFAKSGQLKLDIYARLHLGSVRKGA